MNNEKGINMAQPMPESAKINLKESMPFAGFATQRTTHSAVQGYALIDILERNLLEGARLVAGKRGGGNELRWVNVMEILDMPHSVQEHELLITTGYHMEDEGHHRDLLAHLKTRGVCGIAIQPGYYIQAIPQYILDEADKLDFPVVELPKELTFSHIMHVLLDLLTCRTQASDRLDMGDLKQRLALWDQMTSPKAGTSAAEPARCVIWIEAANNPAMGEGDIKAIARKITQSMQPWAHKVQSYTQGTGTLLYAKGGGLAALGDVLLDIGTLLTEVEKTQSFNLTAGAGIAHAGQSVDSALDDAVAALRTMQAIGVRRGLFQPSNIEFYRMVASIHHAGGGQSTALSRTLQSLMAYDHEHNTDYLRTLRRYLASEGNLSACAQKLYIHRHTLNNRLVKIEELCDVCLSDYPVRMQLGIELMLMDLFDTATPV